MSSRKVVEQQLEEFPENHLIFASQLYNEILVDSVTESSYYKILERLCQTEKLCRIARGTYYRPRKSKYGIVPLLEQEIINAFTANNRGTVVGYTLFNSLNLTTQISGTVEVYSSALEKQTQRVSNVCLKQHRLFYSRETSSMIHMLEILQHFYEIQDMNYRHFLEFCQRFSECYNEEVFSYVTEHIRYSKKTIAFMQSILNHYGVPNNLNRQLSSLSEYKYPKMEEIYEAAQIQ